MRFHIGVASLDHVKKGITMGIAQLGHGKHTPVKKLKQGDFIIYYSPKTEMGSGDAVQSFTAIGKVTSEDAYQPLDDDTMMIAGVKPWRVDVSYFKDAQELKLDENAKEQLEFSKGKGNKWGMVFRRGSFEIGKDDFLWIANRMLKSDQIKEVEALVAPPSAQRKRKSESDANPSTNAKKGRKQ
jgi:hypothetical protein